MKLNLLRKLIKEVLSTPTFSWDQINKKRVVKGKGEKAKEVEITTLNTPITLNFDPNNKEYIKDLGNQTFKIHRDSEKEIPIIFSWQLPGALSYKDLNGDWHSLPKEVIFNGQKYSTGPLSPLKALKHPLSNPHIIIPPGMKQLIIEYTAKQAALRLRSKIHDRIDVIVTPQSSSELAITFANELAKELGIKHIINNVVEKDFSATDFVIPPNKIAIAKKTYTIN